MSRLTCGHIQHMYSWWWVRLSPETCRVKPLRRIKTQLLHLVGLTSLLKSMMLGTTNIKSSKVNKRMELQTGKTFDQRVLIVSGCSMVTSADLHIPWWRQQQQRRCTIALLTYFTTVCEFSIPRHFNNWSLWHTPNVRWNLGRCGSWRGESRTDVPNAERSPINYL